MPVGNSATVTVGVPAGPGDYGHLDGSSILGTTMLVLLSENESAAE